MLREVRKGQKMAEIGGWDPCNLPSPRCSETHKKMKKYFLPLGLMLVISLISCTPSPQDDASASNPKPAATPSPDADSSADVETDTATDVDASLSVLPKVGTYTLDELVEVDGGGCGMSLSRAEGGGDSLFSSGLDGEAFMVFDGQLTPLGRTAASGGMDFYGQQTAQTFTTSDGEITVQVDVTLGAPGEIEGVDIPSGTIAIKSQGESLEIPVVGGAGC